MIDRNANLKFWGTLAVAMGTALALAAALGIADSCEAGFAAVEIRKRAAAGCGEFWLNRYQGLVVGALSTLVAAVAAILVLRQLKAMAEQNSLAQEALKIAEKQRTAEERQHLSAALEVTQRLYAQMSLVPLTMGDALKSRSDRAIGAEYSEQVKRLNPITLEFRRSVPAILATDEERTHYREYEDRTSGAALYFFVSATEDFLGIDAGDARQRARYPANDASEAIANVFHAILALWQLQTALSKRLGHR